MDLTSKENEFTLLIGRGLSAFGRIEMTLAEVFTRAIQAEDQRAAEKVFWSVNSLEARTAMTNAALKAIYPFLSEESEIPRLWVEIAVAMPQMAKKRAELAHGNYIGTAWISKKGKHQDQFFAPYFGKNSLDVEPFSQRAGYDPRPSKRLYLPDLKARLEEFSAFEAKIRHLVRRIFLELPEPSEQKAIRELRRSERGRPSSNRKKSAAPQRPDEPPGD